MGPDGRLRALRFRSSFLFSVFCFLFSHLCVLCVSVVNSYRSSSAAMTLMEPSTATRSASMWPSIILAKLW